MPEMTGTVTLLDGDEINAPHRAEEGMTGIWKPSDDHIHPITPMKVVFHEGGWWSEYACASHLKERNQK